MHIVIIFFLTEHKWLNIIIIQEIVTRRSNEVNEPHYLFKTLKKNIWLSDWKSVISDSQVAACIIIIVQTKKLTTVCLMKFHNVHRCLSLKLVVWNAFSLEVLQSVEFSLTDCTLFYSLYFTLNIRGAILLLEKTFNECLYRNTIHFTGSPSCNALTTNCFVLWQSFLAMVGGYYSTICVCEVYPIIYICEECSQCLYTKIVRAIYLQVKTNLIWNVLYFSTRNEICYVNLKPFHIHANDRL